MECVFALTTPAGNQTLDDRANEVEGHSTASGDTGRRYRLLPKSLIRKGVGLSQHTTASETNFFRRVSALQQSGGYTDAREFYDYLLNRVTIQFNPKIPNNTDGDCFGLVLSKRMSYDQFSAKVGERLGVDPTHIRFSTVNSTSGKPKQVVKRNPNQNLWQILSPQFSTYNNSNQRNDALYYEVLDMSLSELDTKKILKVTWVSEGVTKEACISDSE